MLLYDYSNHIAVGIPDYVVYVISLTQHDAMIKLHELWRYNMYGGIVSYLVLRAGGESSRRAEDGRRLRVSTGDQSVQ